MKNVNLLRQKETLTVYEAARLLRITCLVKDAIGVIVDAVEAQELTASVKRWPRFDGKCETYVPDGCINQLETTVQRSDIDAWLRGKGLAIDLPVVVNPTIGPDTQPDEQRTTSARAKTRSSNATTRSQCVESAATEPWEGERSKLLEINLRTTTHRLTKRSRFHALLAAIAIAKQMAVDAADYHNVWAALVTLANASSPPPPLLGYVKSAGLKYEAYDGVAYLNKRAFRGLMSRAAPAESRNRPGSARQVIDRGEAIACASRDVHLSK